MSTADLQGRRVLITQADAFIGPVLVQVFTEQGADVVASTASALRGMKRRSSYSAVRGAQLAWVQAAGVELAAHHVQLNAIAQKLGRLVSGREDAMFAAYLCSDAADCFVGQVFPVCGGWVQR
jgi:2-keto-3-deoxy-L-fuconate dehydrogenase